MNASCRRFVRTSLVCALALTASIRWAGAQTTKNPELEKSLGDEVQKFVEADRVSPPAACQVLFVGSSSIVKWKETLASDMTPLPVINRGFGGSHIEYVNKWFDQIVAPYHPRAIVFYAGENDLDAGKPVERVVSDFDQFMERKTKALADTPVYFISLKPSKLRFAQFPLQTLVNNAIRDRAAERSDLLYIDVVAPMLDQTGKPKDIFVSDGLHMNAAGYAIWKGVVRPVLLSHNDTDQQSCAARGQAAENSAAHP